MIRKTLATKELIPASVRGFLLSLLCTALIVSTLSCAAGPFSSPKNDAPTYNGDISTRRTIPFFILVGDPQRTSLWELMIGREQNDSARQLVFSKIAEENPAFLIILGDLVYQGDGEDHWKDFDDTATPVLQKGIPVFPLFGNHEYYGSNARAFDHFFNRFPHLGRRFWNSVRFDSIAIILLNSNFVEMDPDQIMTQDEWYQDRLEEYQEDNAVETIIVCCHHPPYTNSKVVSDDRDVQERFVKPFAETPKARLFVSGHCHSYEHFVKSGKHFIVSGGGGGPRQKLELDTQKQRHRDEYAGGEIREFHFCKVLLETTPIRVQMIRLDEKLESWSIREEFEIE